MIRSFFNIVVCLFPFYAHPLCNLSAKTATFLAKDAHSGNSFQTVHCFGRISKEKAQQIVLICCALYTHASPTRASPQGGRTCSKKTALRKCDSQTDVLRLPRLCAPARPSAAAPFSPATALRCLAPGILLTTAPLSFHCNIRLWFYLSRNFQRCQFGFSQKKPPASPN